jgi:site-specific DNA-methyltransferase (adenine-specific)
MINRIHNVDCVEGMYKLADNSVDLVVTSPPYADRRKSTYGGVTADVYNDWFIEIAHEIKRVLKPSGSFFLNIKPHCDRGERVLYVYDLILALKREVGFRFVDEFAWTKNGMPGKFNGRFKNAFEPVYHFALEKGYTFNPYEVATEVSKESLKRYERKAGGKTRNGSGLNVGFNGSTKCLPSNHLHLPQKSNQHTLQAKHPAVFPVELPEFFIKAFSNEGDIVLDPFMGSGTTAVAAVNNNRKYIGFELSEEYIEIANKRLIS